MKVRQSRGFTLIELVITVAIVALLASVALPVVELTVQRSREQDLRTALREIRAGIDAYKRASDEGRILKTVKDTGYPPTLAALVDGGVDAKTPDKKKIYFLRRLPSDPMQPAVKDPIDAWGNRSYASPPDRPEEGDDVYEVYSRSDGVGLNGPAVPRMVGGRMRRRGFTLIELLVVMTINRGPAHARRSALLPAPRSHARSGAEKRPRHDARRGRQVLLGHRALSGIAFRTRHPPVTTSPTNQSECTAHSIALVLSPMLLNTMHPRTH